MRLALAATIVLASCSRPATGSVGAVFVQQKDTRRLVVRDAPEGLGSAKAGLLPGDVILAIDGEDVRDMTPDDVRDRLRGVVGTTVRLTVERDGKIQHATVERAPFKRPK